MLHIIGNTTYECWIVFQLTNSMIATEHSSELITLMAMIYCKFFPAPITSIAADVT